MLEITLRFEIVSRDDFDGALEVLEDFDVFGDGEGPDDNTDEENIEILIIHLGMLCRSRGKNVGWLDLGLERVQ